MFDYWIASPIKLKVPEGYRRLENLVKATCLRRTKTMIGHSFDLPQRIEEVEWIDLHLTDQRLYDFFKLKTENIASRFTLDDPKAFGLDGLKENNIIVLINFLRLICNHGTQLLSESAREAWRSRDSASIDWQTMREYRERCNMCEREVDGTDLLPSTNIQLACRHFICVSCVFRAGQRTTEEKVNCLKCAIALGSHEVRGRSSQAATTIPPSAKIEALLRKLQHDQAPSHQRVENPIKRFVIHLLLDACSSD